MKEAMWQLRYHPGAASGTRMAAGNKSGGEP